MADDAKVSKNSDADFPTFRWTQLTPSKIYDPKTGLCDPTEFLTALDTNGDGVIQAGEVLDWLTSESNQNALRKLIVKFKSEWDGRDLSRWEHVKDILARDPNVKQQALQRRINWLQRLVTYHQSKRNVWNTRLEQAQAREKQIADQAKQKGNGEPTPQDKKTKGKKANSKKTKDLTPQARWQDAHTAAMQRTANIQKHVKGVEAFLKEAPAKIQGLQQQLAEAMKQKADPNLRKVGNDQYQNQFLPHIQKLQFWDKVPGLPQGEVWHFHPLYFIQMFKKCHWMSDEELSQIFKAMKKKSRDRYRESMNRMVWKYGLNSPVSRQVV